VRNGSGHDGDGGHDRPGRPATVTSIEEARRRAEQAAKDKARAARGSSRAPAGAREMIVGGVLVIMALAMVAAWVVPLVGGAAR
jgi:hypothetical protein